MAVQFILGRAGSGKTHLCLEAIRDELRLSQRGPALVLLVPEQATYQVERALVTTPGLGGYARAFVLSFRRLAYQVFLQTGGPGLPPLESAGKQMVLRAILENREADLKIFGESARRPGFVERLAATLTEFRAYSQSLDRLRVARTALENSGEADSLLGRKLHDLLIVIEEFDHFLAERYADPDTYLDLLPKALQRRNEFQGSQVWVDGFASFTGQEERVLDALMQVANEVRIALCLDPADVETGDGGAATGSGDLSIFSLLRDTCDRLTALARQNRQVIRPPVKLPAENQPTRFSATPALDLLEQSIFRDGEPAGDMPPPSTGAVTLSAANDQRSEVRQVAAEILHLCRLKGYRFRDIAVIARDLTGYESLIETIFTDYEIPHFIDVRRDVAHHPAVELIRAALAVAVREWRSADVIRFAKTDLAPLDRGQVDALENYVLAHGIEGRIWLDSIPWTFRRRLSLGEDSESEEDEALLARVNEWRTTLGGSLQAFVEAMAKKKTPVRSRCQALYELLDSLETPRRLETWAEAAEDAGRLDLAGEHRQVWGAIVDLFDQAVAALGDEPVTADEFRDLIETGLAGIRMRLVPPALDQVLVGSIERSRHPEIRVAFIVGMNERVFPQPQREDVVFADRERDWLEGNLVRLGPDSIRRMLHERFLAYIAFTRPSERLYVSYARSDPMGKELHPSALLDDLKRCLPDLREREESDASVESIAHWRPALSGLVATLRNDALLTEEERAEWIALYETVRRDGSFLEALTRRVPGLTYSNKATGLGKTLSGNLYGKRPRSSVSRLETFAACPFKHFARYGLGLDERLRFQLEYVDLGQLYHAALKEIFETLSGGEPLDWAKVDPERAEKAAHEAIDRLAPQLRNEILLSTAHNRYLLDTTHRAMGRFVRILIEQARRDRFVQESAEFAFPADDRTGAGPLEIDLDGGGSMILRGRIDRIDRCGDANAVRVIDFKSRARRFKLAEFAHGLTLQLPAYLLAVVRAQAAEDGPEPVPAGALYLNILREVCTAVPGDLDKIERDEEDELKAHMARGFFDFAQCSLFDGEMKEGEPSPVVKMKIKQDGQPYKWSDACTDNGVAAILAWTEHCLREFARRIAGGEVAVLPYQLGNRTPCTWCEFRPVCRFDAQLEPYRSLTGGLDLDWIREQVND